MLVPPALAQRERDTYSPNTQGFEVNGEVRFTETGAIAANVPVRLERFSGGLIDQIVTDSRGRFRFPGLARGYYRVIINAPGYRPAQQDADMQVVARVYLVFELTADAAKSSSGLPALADVIDARVPAEAREAFSNGRVALTKKSYREAVGHFEKAVFAYSEFFDAQLLLGIAFMDLKEWDNAEKTLVRAVEIEPENGAARIYLGETYWRQKRHKDAEAALLEGLKLDEKSWHGQFTLGRLYWDMGEIAKAGGPIGMTLQLKPDLAEAHLLAGNILLRVAPKGEFVSQVQELVRRVEKSLAEKN
jgi:tetratricopeptide (TPR) repeat protein